MMRATGNSTFSSLASTARTVVRNSSFAFQRLCPREAIFQIRTSDRFMSDVSPPVFLDNDYRFYKMKN